MNNQGFQQLLNELGDRIFCITLNNNHKIFVNVAGDNDNTADETHVPYTKDFQYKTVAGDDLFGIPRVVDSWGGRRIKTITWVRTALVEIVIALQDEDETQIPDLQSIF